MKISTRLSLTFSAISSIIFILFGIGVYLFSSSYRKNNFQERLKERVIVTEKMFLEKETFSPAELKKITDQFLHTLPKENKEVIEVLPNQTPQFKHEYSQEVKNEILSVESYYFQDSERQGMSRRFHVKGKNYLIVVVAVDEEGLQNLSFLSERIILLILIGIPLIFIGGFVITKRALLPLSKKIAHADQIGISNLHERLKVYNPNDEIGKLATAFNRLLDRLEESFDAQKSFISNASHEIKNPLTAIIGETEVALSRSRTKEEYIESLSTILTEAEKLSSTTNNLLQLSKVTGNEENIHFEQVDFEELVTETKKSFDFLNVDNRINLEFSLKTINEPSFVFANKQLLKTAIINLLDNACKFSSNGEVSVKLKHSDSHIILTIIDKGIGIAQQDIDKVVIPFQRGNNALKIAGSGIGLSLSFKIVELHNGSLNIESKLESGTKISLYIPRVTAQA